MLTGRYGADLLMHVQEERNLKLDQIKDDIDSGIPRAEALRRAGVSIATYRRWKKERDNPKQSDLTTSVDLALEYLVEPQDFGFDYVKSIFYLSAWIRWPSHPEQVEPLVFCYLITYYAEKAQAKAVIDIDREVLDRILALMPAATFRRVFSSNPVLFEPYTWLRLYENEDVSERDLLAETAEFLIFCRLKGRQKASLSKAYEQDFWRDKPHIYDISRRTFDKLWRSYAAAAPFYFIQNFHSGLTVELDPYDSEFVGYVDDIRDNRAEFLQQLGKYKWVVEQLRDRLDPRALAKIQFPIFPETLNSVPVERNHLDAERLGWT